MDDDDDDDEQSVEWLAGETEVLGDNPPNATLSTTNPTLPDLGCGGVKPATNRLRCGTASISKLIW
jgi:hypothetical protein